MPGTVPSHRTSCAYLTRNRADDVCALPRRAQRQLRRELARLAELTVTFPPTILGLLGTAGHATPAQLADLDRRAASSGGPQVEDDFRRARIVAAARYALSPQPRAAEEAAHEALHARTSFEIALDVLRHRLD